MQISKKAFPTFPKPGKPGVESVPLSVRVAGSTLQTQATFSVDLEPGGTGPRNVTANVRVSAIHDADAHPPLTVTNISVYEKATGKLVHSDSSPTPLASAPSRDGGQQFALSFPTQKPQAEVGKEYVVVVTSQVNGNGQYRVRSEVSKVVGAL